MSENNLLGEVKVLCVALLQGRLVFVVRSIELIFDEFDYVNVLFMSINLSRVDSKKQVSH